MKTPMHHPDEALILKYAGGCQDEAINLIMSTHIHHCPHCQNALSNSENICGHYFSELDIAKVKEGDLEKDFDQLWSKIENNGVSQEEYTKKERISPLDHYLQKNKKHIKQQSVFSNISEQILPISTDNIKVSIMEIGAGVTIPQHAHQGYEITQVLSGGFTDQKGIYNSGDMVIKGHNDQHEIKILEDAPCRSLVVRCGDLKFLGTKGILYNMLFKIFD